MDDRKIAQLGEFPLIARIARRIGADKRAPGVVVGLGDDAFAARLPAGELLVATKDMLVEDVHFRRSWISPSELGFKAMAVNLSDLAAMGGARPLYALVGLALPSDVTVRFIDGLYDGMRRILSRYGAFILGGDTVGSKGGIAVSVTLLGSIPGKRLLRRSGARPGDIICVTGTTGDAAGGLVLLERGVRRGTTWQNLLIRRHLLPEPRLAHAGQLAARALATSLTDASDGLDVSVRLLCEASGTGARIDLERVPVSPQLRKLDGPDPLHLALFGGEDYELVFTVRPARLARTLKILPDVTPVGTVTAGGKVEYWSHGKPQTIETGGFKHFR